MTLGIKVGPQSRSISDLAQSQAPFCEVWFDINREALYDELFTYIREHHISAGLHFWGVLAGNIWTNIAHPQLTDDSATLIKKTIDIAAANRFSYVNIHPGSRSVIRLDLAKFDFEVTTDPVSEDTARDILFTQASKLNRYAQSKNVILTIETVPTRVIVRDARGSVRSRVPLDVYEISNGTVRYLAENGLYIANDFGHTGATIMADSPDPVRIYLDQFTRQTAARTRLLHLGFLVPPYNGTDFHDSLANPAFDTPSAVPDKQQMIRLLKMFSNRDDVWALVEPESDHVGNYLLAKKLLAESENSSYQGAPPPIKDVPK